MIRATRKYRISASHRLHAQSLNEADNRALYGKCNNPFGHGHNYEIAITVEGPLDDWSGRVVDPSRLDNLVRRVVVEPMDHRYLNQEVPEFRDSVPTSENLGREIARRLRAEWDTTFPPNGPKLDKVVIAETGRNVFEVSAHEIE